MRRLHVFVLSLVFLTQTPAFARNEPPREACAQEISRPPAEIPNDLTRKTADAIYADLIQGGMTKRKAGGYAKLVATMVLSAAAATYLTASIPNGFQFLSIFISQLAAIGVYEFGAPILEPVRSRFRQMSFVVQRGEAPKPESNVASGWEGQWWRTQEALSLNAQMGRNVTTQFIIAVQQNFYEAHRAMQGENEIYAVEQIASAAYRMRTWYGDNAPDDPAVAEVVRAAFTNHFVMTNDFVDKVRGAIARKDSSFAEPSAAAYYGLLLRAWLGAERAR